MSVYQMREKLFAIGDDYWGGILGGSDPLGGGRGLAAFCLAGIDDARRLS